MSWIPRLRSLGLRVEKLLADLARREALHERMRALGEQIDAAWRDTGAGPLSAIQRLKLKRFQAAQQKQIETLRRQGE
ncbi:MAG: hypothetical protein ACP5U2_10455 [Bryobacteraceae bacterium]